jgi:hypothetical protein
MCIDFIAPFTGLQVTTLDSCTGTTSGEHQSSKVSIAVGLEPQSAGLCEIAATLGYTTTYQATGAEFRLQTFSEGYEIRSSDCELETNDLYTSRGVYVKSIPLTCTNPNGAATQYINYSN